MSETRAAPADHHTPDGAADGAVTFSFEGQQIQGLPGQSIAQALYAAGIRIFSRSFKYHRPRGFFCGTGDCPTCLMQVDGRPNVRTCIEPACNGQTVERQNAWPSADFDLLRTFDRLDRFLPVGFYYKSFHKPRWIWPIFEHVVRHIAGLGRIDVNSVPETDCSVEYHDVDICVIGAGPAGLAAAAAAAQAGCRVALVEREAQPGGDLLLQTESLAASEADWAFLQQSGNVVPLFQTTAFGLYEGNLIGAFQVGRLIKIRAAQIIVCTGGREQPFVFHNNDLPGIMLGSAALRLLSGGVKPGRRAVVYTNCDRGHRLAKTLAESGVAIASVIDSRAMEPPGGSPWPVAASSTIVSARGRSQLSGLRIARIEQSGELVAGTEQRIDCDLLCMVSRLAPSNELLLQAGVRFQNSGGCWLVSKSVPGVSAAGAVAGTADLNAQRFEGRTRGAEAAAAVGRTVPALERIRLDWEANQAETSAVPEVADYVAGVRTDPSLHKRFICLCEDVTEKDLERAVAEGFDSIETLKRYSTANMGPCQGKMCGNLAVRVCARATGRSLDATGTTTSRPPAAPVELCVLAAANHHPVRRTPLHHWHESAGAKWMDAGQWKRPESYGDPNAEVHAVRKGVGLIDVSTLGKIELAGPDAAELLDRVYINRWTDLKVGRCRYGVMCNEDGIIFDDGVCGRTARDRFYMTATTGNAEGVFQWLEMWRATWRLNVRIVNQTSAMAAINVAGPRSRELLSRLTRLDLSNSAFSYMALREADVAGVACRLLRIGFVGELGYEIHCPSALVGSLWESIVEAGRDFGMKPFGVESQRILRLEKGHIIIGADSDALSNPLEAGLESMVRFDKPEFIGRPPLVRYKERGPRGRLVGFVVPDRKQPVPEGTQVVMDGYPVGRITSSRVSPTVGETIGLAWVPPRQSPVGSRFLIHWDGTDVDAVVAALPFYDPQGARLKM